VCLAAGKGLLQWRRLRLAIVAVPSRILDGESLYSITRSYVGPDGILHLDVPIEVHDAEIEVMVTLKAVTPTEAKTQKS